MKAKSPTKEVKNHIVSLLRAIEPKYRKKLAPYQAYSDMLWFEKLRDPIMELWEPKKLKGATRYEFISHMNAELKRRLAKEPALVQEQVLDYIYFEEELGHCIEREANRENILTNTEPTEEDLCQRDLRKKQRYVLN